MKNILPYKKVSFIVVLSLFNLNNVYSQNQHALGFGIESGISRWNYYVVSVYDHRSKNKGVFNYGFEFMNKCRFKSNFGISNVFKYKTMGTNQVVYDTDERLYLYDYSYTNYFFEYAPNLDYHLKRSTFSAGLNVAYFLSQKSVNNFNNKTEHFTSPQSNFDYPIFSKFWFTGVEFNYSFQLFENKLLKSNIVFKYAQYFRPNMSSFMIGLRFLTN
jgi:hypothetical protein